MPSGIYNHIKRLGCHHTAEAKRKISESHKGKHTSPETEFKKGRMSTHYPPKQRYRKKCPICGKKFWAKIYNRVYCSYYCKQRVRRYEEIQRGGYNPESRKCLKCNKMFRPWHKFNVFCSKECNFEYRKIKLTDRDFREYMFENENFTCEICGKRTIELQLHHKLPLYKLGKDELENLQVLCFKCHKTKHHIM